MNRPVLSRSRRRRRRGVRPARILLPALAGVLILLAAYYVFFFPKQAEEMSYPLSFEKEIGDYAEIYGLDPARVAAVIYCESSFRPDAVSGVGARGLMQIMPETGKWIAAKLQEEEIYTDEKLFDPEWNIRYGCWYLSYLSERYGGDFRKVTAAYHAGGGSVDKWLADERYSGDGVTLSALPEGATGDYVNKVAEVYEKYRKIFENKEKQTA